MNLKVIPWIILDLKVVPLHFSSLSIYGTSSALVGGTQKVLFVSEMFDEMNT